ncbi:MAG: esterase family protein [Muribaculaceae bacterium]|nr:esterase family protein [Muribaculaceae bacterium]
MNVIKYSIILSVLSICASASAQLPQYDIIDTGTPASSYGNITRMAVDSEYLGGKIIVDVWTPSQYAKDDGKRYPVVYAHDGQNLFDASFSFAGVPWAIDKACVQLANDPDFVMPIVVGINNRGSEGLRPNDYFPENALDYISPEDRENTFIYDTCKDIFLGNEEAAFVATELKPLIDTLYETAPGVTTTFAMGSSMGGLASIYLLCEYPEIFGGAACLSTHWIGSLSLNADYTMNDDEICANAILQYLSDHLPTDGIHRLYMDQGTKDWDAGYLKYEVEAREIVRTKGYTEENGQLYVYDAKGAGHNEWYWQQRVKIPLKFLLSKSAIDSAEVMEIAADAVDSSKDAFIYDLSGKIYPFHDYDHLPAGLYIARGKRLIKR